MCCGRSSTGWSSARTIDRVRVNPRPRSFSMYHLDRRHFLRTGTAAFTVSVSGWLGRLACAAGNDPKRKRSCVLLWMNGGPATIDLWDLKPGAPTGGPFKEAATRAPGLKISEHLPKLGEFG